MSTILTSLMCEEKSLRCCVRIRHHTSSSLSRTPWLNSHQCLKTSIQPSRRSAIQTISIIMLNNSQVIPTLAETKACIINQGPKHSIKTLPTSLEAVYNTRASSHRSSMWRRPIYEMKIDTISYKTMSKPITVGLQCEEEVTAIACMTTEVSLRLILRAIQLICKLSGLKNWRSSTSAPLLRIIWTNT